MFLAHRCASGARCAFAYNVFPEINIPSNCTFDEVGHQFFNNKLLKKIHLPDALSRIPYSFAEGCWITDVNIPANIKSIGDRAFDRCYLQNIEFPEGLQDIGMYAFWGLKCKRIELPSTITYLGFSCFDYSDYNYENELEEIVCKAADVPVCQIYDEQMDKYGNPFPNKQVPVYVRKELVDAYKQAEGWNFFENIIGMDFSGVEQFQNDNKESEIFNLSGVRVDRPEKGTLYIQDGKLILQK